MTRTEALRQALEAVWSGADRVDAEAVMDHLADAGFEVTETPEGRRSAKHRGTFDELPLASTVGLPKKAAS